MMDNHTPGPWKGSYAGPPYMVRDQHSRPIAECPIYLGGDIERANAQLIAAAPDMLAALVRIVADWDEPHYGNLDMARDTMFDGIEAARAVIAKAKGQ